ncbi:MAG TPA: hypothetical protein VMU11_03980 [Verrucomicrobiae bacterium]|nr:hypothetical protein [Verrucomicrobiae bacterium]
MRIFTCLFLVLSALCVAGACVHPQSHELLPWQLTCDDTPDGDVGVIWNPEPDLEVPLGMEDEELAYFAICNRTHRPLHMADLVFAQRPISGDLVSSHSMPVVYQRVFRSGDDLTMSAAAFFGGEWLIFLEDTMDVGDELRRFTVAISAGPSTGEVEFRIGNPEGTFADDGVFSTDEGPLPPERIWHNVAYTRHITVTNM